MGIKFHCPNGHKLNVKSFLAGRRGVCPHCGARMMIPLESESGRRSSAAAAAVGAAGPAASVAGLATASPGIAPGTAVGGQAAAYGTGTSSYTAFGAGVAAGGSAGSSPSRAPFGANAASNPAPTAPAPTPAPAAPDPIDEAPTAVWYVRPPSGGQYGPARGDILRKWIAEGRVTGDSHVWREGWPDWRLASEVLPALARGAVK